MSACIASGPRRSASGVEPTRSAKSTVTCLRSPSRARRLVEDALGEMLRCVGAGRALAVRGFGRSRRHTAGPGECASVPHGHPLDLDHLLDQLTQGIVVEVELALEGAERDAPVAFQERPGLLDGFQEAHRPRFSMPKVRFYALGTFPVSPTHWPARRPPTLPNSGDMSFRPQSVSRPLLSHHQLGLGERPSPPASARRPRSPSATSAPSEKPSGRGASPRCARGLRSPPGGLH